MITHATDTTATNHPLAPVILNPENGGPTELHIPILGYQVKQVGTLRLTEQAINWLRQVRQVLDKTFARGIPHTQLTNDLRNTIHDLGTTLEAAPVTFGGYAALRANSFSQGSLWITRGPFGGLSVKVWRCDEDGFERGLGHQGCMLGAGPKRCTPLFAAHDAERALTVIRDILCAPDVLVRACAREKF